MKKTLFISYSHSDNKEHKWLERLNGFLDAIQEQLPLNIWDDTKIYSGADWRKAIEDEVSKAAAAILLVGQGFLASKFIKEKEMSKVLPPGDATRPRLYLLYVGYCPWELSMLEPYQAFNDPANPLESLSTPEQNKWMNKLCIAITKDLLDTGTRNIEPHTQFKDNMTSMKQISNLLEIAFAAFQAQGKRRNLLVKKILSRLNLKLDMQYEQFFFSYYDLLNEVELFEFQQIRAYTEGPMYESNKVILEIIEQNPQLRDVLPILGALKTHLTIWLSKFLKVFTPNTKMAVCYVGVEDNVPFPEGVDKEIATWIKNNP